VICLEEMLKCSISEGAIYYFKIRKRIPVLITDELRTETINLSKKFHELIVSEETPKAEYTKKCESCSFIDECFPETAGRRKSVNSYIKRRLSLDLLMDDE
jgi:CRISPR-associated exonuclease Cas4